MFIKVELHNTSRTQRNVARIILFYGPRGLYKIENNNIKLYA